MKMKTMFIFLAVFGLAVCMRQTGYAGSLGKNAAVPMEQTTIARSSHGGTGPALEPKPVPRGTVEKISPVQPSLPVNAGQKHGVAIIGGPAMKTSHENGVINGTERKRLP